MNKETLKKMIINHSNYLSNIINYIYYAKNKS